MFKRETYQVDSVAGELFTFATDWQEDEFASWLNRMLAVVRDLEQRLISRYLNAIKEQPLKRYVRFHQKYLISLSDRIFELRDQKTEIERKTPNYLNEVLAGIEKVLENVRRFAGQDFDLSTAVSHFQKESTVQTWYTFEPALGTEIDRKLLEAIASSLNLLDDHQRLPTFHELLFAENISKITSDLLTDAEVTTYIIFDRLYIEDFNAPEFALWYQQDVLERIKGVDAPERTKVLDREFKRLQLSGVHPLQSFLKGRLPIVEELTNWLIKLSVSYTDMFNVSPQRLPLNLSVAQLGLFLRLCFETGCFHEHNISGVLRFFVQHFTSKKQSHISKKSLAKAFYGADQSTAATCRAWLLLMVDQLNNRYFPK